MLFERKVVTFDKLEGEQKEVAKQLVFEKYYIDWCLEWLRDFDEMKIPAFGFDLERQTVVYNSPPDVDVELMIADIEGPFRPIMKRLKKVLSSGHYALIEKVLAYTEVVRKEYRDYLEEFLSKEFTVDGYLEFCRYSGSLKRRVLEYICDVYSKYTMKFLTTEAVSDSFIESFCRKKKIKFYRSGEIAVSSN